MFKKIGLILLVIGGVLIVLMSIIIVNFYRDILHSTKVTATVVSFREEIGGSRRRQHQFFPTVRYSIGGNRELSAELDTYLYHQPLIGEKINILYRTDMPNKIHLDTVSHIFFGPILFMLALLGLEALGFYMFYFPQSSHNFLKKLDIVFSRPSIKK